MFRNILLVGATGLLLAGCGSVPSETGRKGREFLAANKTKPGVVTTPSGLQYQVLTQGTGARPAAGSTVRVQYKGSHLDGTVFQSSYDRGTPAEFALEQVLDGWAEGVQLMPVGSRYMFYIPSELAYGSDGSAPNIGADETLIFEIELLDILQNGN